MPWHALRGFSTRELPLQWRSLAKEGAGQFRQTTHQDSPGCSLRTTTEVSERKRESSIELAVTCQARHIERMNRPPKRVSRPLIDPSRHHSIDHAGRSFAAHSPLGCTYKQEERKKGVLTGSTHLRSRSHLLSANAQQRNSTCNSTTPPSILNTSKARGSFSRCPKMDLFVCVCVVWKYIFTQMCIYIRTCVYICV